MRLIKKYIVYIAVLVLTLPLFSCSVPGAPAAASDASQTACVTKPQTAAYTITGVSQAADDGGYCTCDYNGIKRKFILYIPEGAGGNAPLLFMLHGYGSSAKGFLDFTDMNSAAERYGFAVVYPQGIRDPGNRTGAACWNSGLTKTGNDDIGFLVALAKYLQQTYNLSSSHTFAAGFSNGAFMMYKLACGAPETFRAVASVAGSMSGGAWDERKETVSTGILQINGTADSVVPIEPSKGVYGNAPAIGGVIEYWKNANNLDELQKVRLSDKAAAYKYSSRENDNLVWYIEIEGYGHSWPKGADISGFSANEVILEFFSSYVE